MDNKNHQKVKESARKYMLKSKYLWENQKIYKLILYISIIIIYY